MEYGVPEIMKRRVVYSLFNVYLCQLLWLFSKVCLGALGKFLCDQLPVGVKITIVFRGRSGQQFGLGMKLQPGLENYACLGFYNALRLE